MHFSRTTKYLCVSALALSLSNTPAFATAVAHDLKLVPTAQVVEEVSRQQKEQDIQKFLSRTDVQNKLMEQGVYADEAKLRLASLSETEINQLSSQVEQARAGGDILVAILLVVLIIFLIKRI